VALLLLAAPAAGQSSFESDPFASRFRERPNLDIRFRAPEAGGVIKVSVSDGKGGRQSLLSESVYEVQAPKGGLVTLEYQDIRLTADYVRADRKTKVVVAEGDVVLEQGPSRLTGLRLELDLTDKTGVLTDGQAELAGIFVRGATLAKTGARTFEIRDGAVTACEGEDPSWEFQVKDGAITLDDYAKLKTVVFRLGGVPLLYTPYLLWPALRDRASGFLIPGVGYSSRRGGWLGLSYFQVLGRSADATVTTGVAPGPSLRYTYSDMTGQQLRLATNPFGYYRHIFEGCADTVSNTEWRDLAWTAETPPGTLLRFRVRTAATRAGLEAAMWVVVADVPPDVSPADIKAELMAAGVTPRRFLELEVRLESTRTSGTAVVTPRVSSMDVAHVCVPIIG